MMYELQISLSGENPNFWDSLDKRFAWMEERGYRLELDNNYDVEHEMYYVKLALQGSNNNTVFRDEDVIYIFKHQISELLAEHIIKDWEKRLIYKEMKRKGRNIFSADKEIIFEKAQNFLKSCSESKSLNLLMNFGRKNKIAHKIMDYIYNNDKLVIEGFINFCMHDYLSEIKFAVDIACEEVKNEKEYNEFIKLLRYFVDEQVPKVDEVNLLMDNGLYYLWDGNGIDIEENYMQYYLDDILRNEINLDDIIISILITISPRKIILHNTDEARGKDMVEVIKNVFKERISICKGCKRCNPENKEK